MRLWPRNPILRLRLRPGDALLLRVPEETTPEEAMRLAARLQAVFPAHNVVVAPQDVQLGVIEVEPEQLRGAAKTWPAP